MRMPPLDPDDPEPRIGAGELLVRLIVLLAAVVLVLGFLLGFILIVTGENN